MDETVLKMAKSLQFNRIVFNEKGSQTNEEPSEKNPSRSNVPGDTPITPKDFYWDQILFYLVSGILGLSFLDISVEFFRGSIIQCYVADKTATREQVAYLNNYCYDSLPNSQYYLIFVLISAVVIIAPHYLWTSYFGAHFNFFFDLAKKFHRLRDTNTGRYDPYNFEIFKKLEQKFSSTNPWIFRWYKLKLFGQLLFCIIVQAVNAFYFDAEDFDESFPCPTDTSLLNTTVWPLPDQLICVYNRLALLYFLRNTALVLVTAAIVVCIIGLVWCYARHTTELGAKDIAAFCDASCLPPEEFIYPSSWKVIRSLFRCGKKNQILDSRLDESQGQQSTNSPQVCVSQTQVDESQNQQSTGITQASDMQPTTSNGQTQDSKRQDQQIEQNPDSPHAHDSQPTSSKAEKDKKLSALLSCLKQIFSPRIKTDLDFLVARLFYADSGHGQVFKDIQIEKEFDERITKDHKLLYLLNTVYSTWLKSKRDSIGKKVVKKNNGEAFKDIQAYFFEADFGPNNIEQSLYNAFKEEMGVTEKDWSHSTFRSVLFRYFRQAPANKLAFDISFGNRIGHSLILARAFRHSVTIHFNKYYKNAQEVCHEDNYQANFHTLTFQADIYGQNAKSNTKTEKLVIDYLKSTTNAKEIDLIVVGPITERSDIISTNIFLQKFHRRGGYFAKKAILLAIRPLMIGPERCTERFEQFKPPQGAFDHNEKEDKTIEVIKCNNVQCFYEFQVFHYRDSKDDTPSNERLTSSNGASNGNASSAATANKGSSQPVPADS